MYPRLKSIWLAKATLVAFAATMPIWATTSNTNTNTVAPTLKVNATIQDAVQLTLSTGSGGCAISAGSGTDYQISFGNVNGLGVGTPSCGSVGTPTSTNVQYTTSYTITASFAGFTTTSSTTIVLTTAGFTHSALLTLAESSTQNGTYTNIPSSGTAVSISGITSGTAMTRYLGLTVANTNGGSAFQGADSATVTFTLTVQ